MNDTVQHPAPADAELGDRIGLALTRRSVTGVTGMSVDLEAVHRGARRRRRRRSGAVVVVSLALVAGGLNVLGRRDLPPPAVTTPSVPLPPPDVIGAAAVLPESYGEPVSVYATAGGVPVGVPLPRIDVWERDTTRVVVRTFDEPVASGPALDDWSVAATTAAESPDATSTALPRTVQLADDQWAQISGEMGWNENAVTVRGASREEAQELFDGLIEIDGALAPPPGFSLVEHVDAQPASAVTGWYQQITYGEISEGVSADDLRDVWVGTNELVAGRDTLELATGWDVGAIRFVDGREVFFSHREQGNDAALQWIDASGIMVYVFSTSGSLDEAVIEDVSLVTQREFEAAADDISERLAVEPARAQAMVDGIPLTVRGTPTNVVGCVGASGDGEQCFFDINASMNTQPNVGMISALVDGEWIIGGYYELGIDGYPDPGLSDERFTTPDGTLLPVVTANADGFAWILIRVPAGVNWIFPDITGEIGSTSRAIRPVVVGALG